MKKLFLVITLLLTLLLSGCIKQIEDTNGEEDHSIVSFTDKDICSKHSSISIGSLEISTDNGTKLSIKKFSGVKTIGTVRANNQTLTYVIDSMISSGNFRMVIVSNNEIVKDIEIGISTVVEIPNANGSYDFRIVGESANFSLEYSVDKR